MTIMRALFEAPIPELTWTGSGTCRDATGARSQILHHAIERKTAVSDDLALLDVPKLLVVEPLPPCSLDDFGRWLAAGSGVEIARALLDGARAGVDRTFSAGEKIAIAYDARVARTRVAWPWGAVSELRGRAPMREIWRACFEHPADAALGDELAARSFAR